MAERIRKPVCVTLSDEAISGLEALAVELSLNKSATVDHLILMAVARSAAAREQAQARLADNKRAPKLHDLFGGSL